jgi:O-antigen ligase
MLQDLKAVFTLGKDENINTQNVRTILIALFGAALPFDSFFSTLIIFLSVLTMLIDFSLKKISFIPKSFWIFSGVIILNGIGYFYSTDIWRAGFLIERQLTILIFPILLPLAINIDKQKTNFIFWIFSICCILLALYLFVNAFFFIFEFNLPIKYIFTSSFFNHNFSAPIGLHATYLSIYFSLTTIFLIQEFVQSEIRNRIFIGISVIVLMAALFFLASRTSIIALATIIAFVFPAYFVKKKEPYFLALFVLLILSIVVGSQSGYMKKRFSTEFAGDITLDKKYTANDPEPRIMRWKCAIEIISKKPLLGHGAGDEIPLLLDAYKKNNMMVSLKEEFNTHNQYLSILIKNGIVGLIAFLAMLIYFFRLAIKQKDFIYFSFLTIIAIGLFTENIIDANKGIFFFAFFNTLLGYNCLNILKQKAKAEM